MKREERKNTSRRGRRGAEARKEDEREEGLGRERRFFRGVNYKEKKEDGNE